MVSWSVNTSGTELVGAMNCKTMESRDAPEDARVRDHMRRGEGALSAKGVCLKDANMAVRER